MNTSAATNEPESDDEPTGQVSNGDTIAKKHGKKLKTMWVTVFRCFQCAKPGHNMPKCGQCSQAYYCSADCQRNHWPQHKRSCKAAVAALARHAHRERLARAVRENGKTRMKGGEEDDLCVICQAQPVDPVEVNSLDLLFMQNSFEHTLCIAAQLLCGHEYCKACLEELRQKGVEKSCPLCRKPLPPGPEKLFDLGLRMYKQVKAVIDRRRPGVLQKTPWPALSTEQQAKMDQAIAMLREGADQGHMGAQMCCGDLYLFGRGVEKNARLSFVYTEKAAHQGHAQSQKNTAVNYREGRGCKQSYKRAFQWYEQAAQNGDQMARTDLGALYAEGRGVQRNLKKARDLLTIEAKRGNPSAIRNLAITEKIIRDDRLIRKVFMRSSL